MAQQSFSLTLLIAAALGASSSGIACAQSADGIASPIIVTGKKLGGAEVSTETELDEQAIGDYAADSVGDLVRQISPLIDGSDDQPILVVNGKRIADPRDIRGYPPEALQRVEILSREAAGRYGYSPDKRVVNLVLKRSYSGLSTEIGITVPTALGRGAETLSVHRVSIAAEARWNVDANIKRETMLLESDRNVPPAPGGASILGNVYASGSELDPRLSALYGRSVTAAAVPAGAADGPLELEDFLPGANLPAARDDAAYRSLAPSTRSIRINAGVTRPVGSVSLSLNLRAQSQHSRRLLGLADVTLDVPAGSPFAPFSNDTILERLLLDRGPLRATQDTNSLGLSGNSAFSALGAHGTLSLVYDHSEAVSRTMRGFDLGNSLDRIANGDPALNPFGRLPPGNPLFDRVKSVSNIWSANLMLSRKAAHLPAGDMQVSFNGGYQHSGAVNAFNDASGPRRDVEANDSGQAQLQFQVPVASRRAHVLGALGELQLQLSGGALVSSGTPLQTQKLVGVNWSPIKTISLNVRVSREEDSPSNDQRSAALIETPGVRIYDYTTGQLAEIVEVSGGNPDLRRGTRSSLSLGGSLRPLGGRALMLNFDYQRQTAKGGVSASPELTPLVESAFPERVERDAAGALVRVDIRPINFARETQASLRSGITLMLPFGPVVLPPATADRRQSDGPSGRSGSAPRRSGRVQISLNHVWQIANSLLIRQGLPVLDRLRGEGGGQSRHQLQLQAMVVRSGAGVSLGVRWQSPYRTRASAAGSSDNDLRFGVRLSTDLKVNFDLGRVAALGKASWLRGAKFSVSVDNLLDKRQRVRRADGIVPAGYTPDEIDPIGRTITIELRRRL